LTPDVGIVRAIDRAAAPIERFAVLMEAIAADREPNAVLKGFRDLHRELVKSGIGTDQVALYRPGATVSPELVVAIIIDLQPRLGVICERISKAALELAQRVQGIAQRLEILFAQPEGRA
jgi:hypothetical protein